MISVLQAHEVGEVGGDAVQVVGREHDGEAVGVEVGEEVQDLVAGAHVDAGRGLVEQQHSGLAEQRPGDEHPLLLAAGELADVAIAEAADAELVEHVVDFGAARRATPTAGRARGSTP